MKIGPENRLILLNQLAILQALRGMIRHGEPGDASVKTQFYATAAFLNDSAAMQLDGEVPMSEAVVSHGRRGDER